MLACRVGVTASPLPPSLVQPAPQLGGDVLQALLHFGRIRCARHPLLRAAALLLRPAPGPGWGTRTEVETLGGCAVAENARQTRLLPQGWRSTGWLFSPPLHRVSRDGADGDRHGGGLRSNGAAQPAQSSHPHAQLQGESMHTRPSQNSMPGAQCSAKPSLSTGGPTIRAASTSSYSSSGQHHWRLPGFQLGRCGRALRRAAGGGGGGAKDGTGCFRAAHAGLLGASAGAQHSTAQSSTAQHSTAHSMTQRSTAHDALQVVLELLVVPERQPQQLPLHHLPSQAPWAPGGRTVV